MVYKWKEKAMISANAQVAGEMCERLDAVGNLTARGLLDANRPEDAPLHNEFEWNDGVAAEKYREQQARHIIGSLVICPEKSEPIRAFFKIESAGNRYTPVTTIMESADSSNHLKEIAISELKAIERKYRSIEALEKVWNEIDALSA